jgi:hypothetical protein
MRYADTSSLLCWCGGLATCSPWLTVPPPCVLPSSSSPPPSALLCCACTLYPVQVNMSFIVACKGIGHLLLALKTHPKRVELLEPAICTLCNLCHRNDPNKEAICKAGGAQCIVDTLLGNFNSIDLILTGFRALGNLAFNASNISIIIKAGGVQAIVAGMTVHAEEMDVIDIAIRVLTNLASDLDEENMGKQGSIQTPLPCTTLRCTALLPHNRSRLLLHSEPF